MPYTHEDAAALLLLGQALSTCFLHRAIREKGGAYGGGAAANVQGGVFSFTSYRDPRTLETLDTFQAAAKWAAATGSFRCVGGVGEGVERRIHPDPFLVEGRSLPA